MRSSPPTFTVRDAQERVPVVIARPGQPPIQGRLFYVTPPPWVLRPNGSPYSQRTTVVLPSGKHLTVKPEHVHRNPTPPEEAP